MTIDTSPTTQDALSLIVQQYNFGKASNLQINGDDFIFETPSVNTNVTYLRNTRLRVRPKPNTATLDTKNIFYNRIDLNTILGSPTIVKGSATHVADIIDLINNYFGINLVSLDYDNDDITALTGDYYLQSKAGSYMFIGALLVKLVAGATMSIAPSSAPVSPGALLSWNSGGDPTNTATPQAQVLTIRVASAFILNDTISWNVAWTPGSDGSGKAPTVSTGFTTSGTDRIYTVSVQGSAGGAPTNNSLASGVGVIQLLVNGVARGNSLVIVVSDSGTNQQGYYESIGTYLTLAEAGL
jgi:hypothetical protein